MENATTLARVSNKETEVSNKNVELLAKSKTARRGRPPKRASTPKFDSRLQIKLTPEGREKLDEMVVRMGAEGVAAVVRDALRIYDIVTEDVVVNGNQLLSRDAKTGEVEKFVFWK